MTNQLALFLSLLGVHWFADFCLQTHWQASNKSKRNDALALHVLSYTAMLAVWVALAFGGVADIRTMTFFVIWNGILHFLTDWCTSRLSSAFYVKQDWHNFFVVIGFDQFLHQLTLALTLALCFGAG